MQAETDEGGLSLLPGEAVLNISAGRRRLSGCSANETGCGTQMVFFAENVYEHLTDEEIRNMLELEWVPPLHGMRCIHGGCPGDVKPGLTQCVNRTDLAYPSCGVCKAPSFRSLNEVRAGQMMLPFLQARSAAPDAQKLGAQRWTCDG